MEEQLLSLLSLSPDAEEGEDADLESADGTGTSPVAGAQDVVAQLLGIPAAAYALECSDERCRRDALAEFLELDAQFSERLEQLDGGWEQRLTHYRHTIPYFPLQAPLTVPFIVAI